MSTKTRLLSQISIALTVIALVAIVLTSAFAQSGDTYLVQPGDSADSIAAEFGVSVDNLLAVNGLTNPAQITPGTLLLIPVQGAAATSTPRGSTAGQAAEDGGPVLEAFPTVIPPTPMPTPLPYDPNRVVDLIDPDESDRFTLSTDSIDIRGVVQFDPATMAFWKLEIRGSRGSSIGSDPMTSIRGDEWVTITTRTDPVIDGYLGTIPGYPTLSLGNWTLRVVAVNNDGTFAGSEEVRFNVSIEDIPPVPVFVHSPVDGEFMERGQDILGSVLLNFVTTAYTVELIGGTYYSWTPIQIVQSNVGDPVQIYDSTLATLPEDLIDGRYRMRLAIIGLNGNYIQEPIVREFAVGTDEVSNLPSITIDEPSDLERRDSMTVEADTLIIGSINVPDPDGYFKLEIRDRYDRRDNLFEGQQPRFNEWTTVGEQVFGSVEDGQLGVIAGPPALPPGNYELRIVIVDSEDRFSDVQEYDLDVRQD